MVGGPECIQARPIPLNQGNPSTGDVHINNMLVKNEVYTPKVLELARDGQFSAQTCKIRDFGYRTCMSVQIRSHIPYADVSDACLAGQSVQGPLSMTRWHSVRHVLA